AQTSRLRPHMGDLRGISRERRDLTLASASHDITQWPGNRPPVERTLKVAQPAAGPRLIRVQGYDPPPHKPPVMGIDNRIANPEPLPQGIDVRHNPRLYDGFVEGV